MGSGAELWTVTAVIGVTVCVVVMLTRQPVCKANWQEGDVSPIMGLEPSPPRFGLLFG